MYIEFNRSNRLVYAPRAPAPCASLMFQRGYRLAGIVRWRLVCQTLRPVAGAIIRHVDINVLILNALRLHYCARVHDILRIHAGVLRRMLCKYRLIELRARMCACHNSATAELLIRLYEVPPTHRPRKWMRF